MSKKAAGAPGKVRVLSEKVRNQIAAGEVVERPASVLKELVENSLDAGAARISIELSGGGRRLVRVADDGCGMGREDLELSVERFATSKLSSAEELETIATLGFRGEALPSIGSVSRLEITSRARGADSAWRLVVEGGEKSGPEPASGGTGTTVAVRDLFFNVPARQKFLKSERAEMARCLDALAALALVRFDVAFSVEHDGRSVLELPPAERLADRVAALNTAELVEGLAEAEAELPSGARCRGLVGIPTLHRQSSADVHLFVNGRPVRDRAASAALNAAYSGLLPLRRYPVVFLFLEFPPGQVDVNVHPTKAEVRFARPGEVFALLERAVRGALARAEMAAAGGSELYGPPREEPSAAVAESRRPAAATRAPAPAVRRPPMRAAPPPPRAPAATSSEPAAEQPRLDLWGGRLPQPADAPAARPERAAPAPAAVEPAPSEGRFLGQALDGFLLVERADGVLVIDQHALHERMLYEDLRAARGRSGGGAALSQGLLVPQTVELSARHAEVIAASRAEMIALGFDIEAFGGRSMLVRAVPAALDVSDLPGYLVGLAEELVAADAKEAARTEEERRERLLATVACKAAVKAGGRLAPEAARDLARRGMARLAAGMPRTCPHGRPLFFLLDRAEFARRVGRKAGSQAD